MSTERLSTTRTIAASPERVFAALSDPDQHQFTEPGDWVRGALDRTPIREVGQVFGIDMFHEAAGGRYEMHNRVTAFDQDRSLEWEPGQYGPDGELGVGGWRWRYDLAPADGGTDVTLTYDWSRASADERERFGLPPFPVEFLDESLASLDRHLTAG